MNTRYLTEKARTIRRRILAMAHRSKGPHVGSSLSCVEILSYLYFAEMHLNQGGGRDRFLLSKAHAAMTLYATLAERGVIAAELLDGYMHDEGSLPAHLDRESCPGVEVSAGALGHGLSMGLGLAHGLELRSDASRVFVLMGDGECQEGAVWEAAMLAPRLGLSNLTAIIDYNDLQGYGRPTELMSFEPLAEKWSAFGWFVVETDGHDFQELEKAFSAEGREQPRVIIARTVKGKGVSFMENELKWHYHVVTDEILGMALEEIDGA